MRALRLASLLIVALAACGGEDEHLPTDAAPVIDAPPGAVDAAIDALSVDAPSSKVCGGIIGATCGPTEYCDFPQNTCGATDEQGVCTPKPTGCPDLLVAVPTCACDNMVYGSQCDAYAAGFDLDASGGCPVPAGQFACGYTQCDIHSQYCQHALSDVATEPDTWACLQAPGCPTQFLTCGCLHDEPCGTMCTGNGPTGLTLTCPGG